MGKTILIIGPASVHVSNFIDLIKDQFQTIGYIGSEGEFYHEAINKKAYYDFKSLNPFVGFKNRKRFTQFVKDLNPDVVHIHQVTRHAFLSIPRIKKLKIPIVITAWGSDVLVMPNKNPLFKFLVKKALAESDYITCDSKEMEKAILKLDPSSQVGVVMFGIEPIVGAVKEKIIYSNRLHEPLYNIGEIIDLFAEFSKSNLDWKLNIGAIGSLTKSLEEKVVDLGLGEKVSFLGWLKKDENIKQYQQASIYVSIPQSDGTAVSLLEAMSAGCVPVTPDLPVSYEWIKDGENGVIHKGYRNPFEEAVGLNQTIVASINSEIIRERATKNVSSQKYQKIYKQLL